MPTDLKAHLIASVEETLKGYLEDLNAMTHEQLAAAPGDATRSAYDFTFETAWINARCATRISGQTPEASPFKGWIMAPDEYKDRDAAIAYFQSSGQALVDALKAADDMEAEIPLPDGKTTTPLAMASMCSMHTAYHDGQLNLLQSIGGDAEVHWSGH